MTFRWAKHIQTRQGFTIVELLIVIVVIAILAAITIVAYNGISTRAADSVKLTEINQVTKQLESFKVENGEYPQAIPESDTTLIAQHNKTSATASMNFVVNKSSMTTLEQQKLASFESSTGIKLPLNSLYFFGRDYSGWGKQVAFIMVLFKDKNNIPVANQSNRAKGGTNNAYPQIPVWSTYPSLCANATVDVNTPQSTGALGSAEAPFLTSSGTVSMLNAHTYNPPQGCSYNTAFLRDNANTADTAGTALFVLKR